METPLSLCLLGCCHKVPQPEWLKQPRWISSQFGRWEVQDRGVLGPRSSEGSKEGSPPGQSQRLVVLGSHPCNGSLHMAFSLGACPFLQGHQPNWIRGLPFSDMTSSQLTVLSTTLFQIRLHLMSRG